MKIIIVLLALSMTGYGYILNWTCDSSGGHNLACSGNQPGGSTYYLNWTDCSYNRPTVYCTKVYDVDQNKTINGSYIIITTGDFSDHTYPCAAFNLLQGGMNVRGLYNNGTLNVSLPQNQTDSFDQAHCAEVHSFLWFKKTLNCGEQNPWTTYTTVDWVHCWQWTWISWITGKAKYTCNYARVDPYEVD